jgi:ATP-dependent RNA helicase DeaD
VANRESQNTGTRVPARGGLVHVLPHDDDAAAHVIAPLLHQVAPDATAPELVVLTADADAAVAIVRALGAQPSARLIPLSSEARGVRLLAGPHAAGAVAGPPALLVALVRRSALKLDRVQTVVLAWADEMLAIGESAALETLMVEIPKDAGRVLITASLSAEVEGLAERYLRRAHRLGVSPVSSDLAPLPLGYVLALPSNRRGALRSVLDEIDPASAAVFARTPGGVTEARQALRELGYPADDPHVRVVSGPSEERASLVVLYDIPVSAEQLRTVAVGSQRVVALARPRDLARLRAIAAAPVTPLPVREPTDRARRREEIAREELRTELRRGIPDRQLLALEPLLEEFDGVEIAAAALRLRERDQELGKARSVAEAPAPRATAWTRLFLTTGTRDNVRPGDLVGMITGEGGVTSDRIGKIELRENHSLVEVAADVAEQVVARINGTQVKGRRIVARPERDRDERGRGAAEGRGRDGARPGKRDDRPRRNDVSRGERRPPKRRGTGEPPASRA